MGEYTTNIGIKNGLYQKLKDRKRPGQSFSGVIEEMLINAEKYEKLKENGHLEDVEEQQIEP